MPVGALGWNGRYTCWRKLWHNQFRAALAAEQPTHPQAAGLVRRVVAVACRRWRPQLDGQGTGTR